MVRDVVSHLDYSIFAQISLTIFVTIFIAVSIRTFFTSQQDIQRMASIPLEEGKKQGDS